LPPPHHITSATTAFATEQQPFKYQITTSKPETSYSAIGLPSGLVIDSYTGLISGGPSEHGEFQVTLGASGQDGTAGATLVLSIDPPGRSTGPFTAVYVTSEVGEPLLNGRDISGGPEDAVIGGYYGPTPNYTCSLWFRPWAIFPPTYDISNE